MEFLIKKKMINLELFKMYFMFEKPSKMLKELSDLNDEEKKNRV